MKPRMFIGSSTEGLALARAIRSELTDAAEITLWNDIAVLGESFLESLVKAINEYDFAVLAVTADDLVASRGNEMLAPRDNVMFELGLFMGHLGRRRTYFVYDKTSQIKIPSDLMGITLAAFDGNRSDASLRSAVASACDQIRTAIQTQGIFEGRGARQLTEAAGHVEGTSQRLAELVELLARSRASELEITSAMFSGTIPAALMRSVEADLAALRSYTKKEAP